MDIVSRLKTFINYISVPVTQFADNCRIPRPTLSQLLNGRNKKVSDELIGKIHETYPQLSVLWLMFGEGDMLHKSYKQISELQKTDLFEFSTVQHSANETINPRLDFGDPFDSTETVTAKKTDAPALSSVAIDISDNSAEMSPDHDNKTTLSFNSDTSKKIVNIIVYYNDNSFESFVPAPDKK